MDPREGSALTRQSSGRCCRFARSNSASRQTALTAYPGAPPRLCAELTKVVIHMKIAPPKPGGVRHLAEYRVRLPVEAPGLRRDELHQRLELRDVRREADRLGPPHLLIDFGPREERSSRPGEGKVQSDPLDHRALKRAGSVAHGLLTHAHAKGVAQM